MLTFGSAQTNGAPIVVTATSQATAQLVHTAPSGSTTPSVLQLFGINTSNVAQTVTIVVTIGGTAYTFPISIPVNNLNTFYPLLTSDTSDLILNGAATVAVFASTSSNVSVFAQVNDQATANSSSAVISSGPVLAVQNASRFAVGAQGGTGQATEANAQITVSLSCVLKNFGARAFPALTGTTAVTVTVRVNGVATALTANFLLADGTTAKTNTASSISVNAGDLITFLVQETANQAGVSTFQAAVEYWVA